MGERLDAFNARDVSSIKTVMAMDRGSWRAAIHTSRRAGKRIVCVESDDFEHDVILDINGDFRDEAQTFEYAEWLAGVLNSPSSAEGQPKIEWQPISACPRNGTAFLCGWWTTDKGYWWVCKAHYANGVVDGGCSGAGEPEELPHATHWMPLPSPPPQRPEHE